LLQAVNYGQVQNPTPGQTVSCRISIDGRVLEQVGPDSSARCWTTLQRS
jgi:hypothetical protein